LDAIINVRADEVALFDPTHFSRGGTDFYEMAVVVENFNPVAVLDDPRFFVDGGDVIPQVGLDSRNVSNFEDASAAAFATGTEN
jgi:hypothetical protein